MVSSLNRRRHEVAWRFGLRLRFNIDNAPGVCVGPLLGSDEMQERQRGNGIIGSHRLHRLAETTIQHFFRCRELDALVFAVEQFLQHLTGFFAVLLADRCDIDGVFWPAAWISADARNKAFAGYSTEFVVWR